MDHEFLSIKQAADRYVVSDVTLRRLAREISRDDQHEFRAYVRPGAAELKALREENKPFEYELSTKLLGVRYKQRDADAEEGSTTISEAQADVGSAAVGVLESTNELLRDQLKVKDEQIRQLNESLRAMQQQQSATNMLLVRLSERIPLLAEGTPAKSEVPAQQQPVDAQTVQDQTRKKPAKAPTKKSKQPKQKPKAKQPSESRGVLGRWFRKSPANAGVKK
jgi:uncharacterized protein YydD (DUF2326 family)